MNNQTIQDHINKIIGGTIKKFSFKEPFNQLILDLAVGKPNEVQREYQVWIDGIGFFLFCDQKAPTTQDYTWEQTQLNQLVYATQKVQAHSHLAASAPIDAKELDLDYYNRIKRHAFDIAYNLHFKINATDLLIKANKLKINDQKFDLV